MKRYDSDTRNNSKAKAITTGVTGRVTLYSILRAYIFLFDILKLFLVYEQYCISKQEIFI